MTCVTLSGWPNCKHALEFMKAVYAGITDTCIDSCLRQQKFKIGGHLQIVVVIVLHSETDFPSHEESRRLRTIPHSARKDCERLEVD